MRIVVFINLDFKPMYEAKTFNIHPLEGLSERQISEHLKLYAGYVKNVNTLTSRLEVFAKNAEEHTYEMSEVRRRLGFEFNGMRLHEYYFEQFEASEASEGALRSAIEAQFGSYDAWKAEFTSVTKMRGVGWVLLMQDTRTGTLHNVWVSDHEVGHLGGQHILLACDVWEHAFLLDYLPGERGNYIEAFFNNLNWQVAEARFKA